MEAVFNLRPRHALHVRLSWSARKDKQQHRRQIHAHPCMSLTTKEKGKVTCMITNMHFFLASRVLWNQSRANATPNTDTISPPVFISQLLSQVFQTT
jgi:hypothetical protein